MELIPPELSMLSAIGLVALSLFTSMLTAAIGIGGGLLMLTVMVSFLPPIVVLPVHGVIQLGSNSGRMALILASKPHKAQRIPVLPATPLVKG